MFFTIKKRIIITVFLISLCIGCTVDARETERFTEEKKWELVNAFTEKVEYIYNYELWFCGKTTILNEDRKALPVFLYWKNGAYYFIPVEDCNAEVEIEGVSRQIKYNEYQEDCYCFYELRPQSGTGRDEGKWSMQYIASMRMEEMEEFTYLGMAEIDTGGEEMPEAESLTENGYISAVVDYLRDCGQLPVGDYEVYIGGYGYYNEADRVWMTGIIKQNETYRWLFGGASRNGNGSYEGIAYPTNGAWESYPPIEETDDDYKGAMRIVEAERLVVDLKVTGREKGAAMPDQKKEDKTHPYTAAIEVTTKEAREKIEAVYNYYNWFFGSVPYDIGLLLEEGKTYRLFTDGDGNIFWIDAGSASDNGAETGCGALYKSELQADIAKLPLYSYTMGSVCRSDLHQMGSMNWREPELRKPELPPMVEDSYIRQVKAYIRDDLTEKGKKGNYQLYFGRYEILSGDIRSISVAVTGEETFYLHFWVTKDPDGTYDCFPVGGSYMGEEKTGLIKAERIIQLDRLRMELEIKGDEKPAFALNIETEGEAGERREIDNPYFPVKEHMTLKVRANYYKGQEPVDEIVDAEIDRLKVYESGSIYKLRINIPIDTAAASYFPVMVRYFYVRTDEIYLIWPFYQAEPNGKCIYFPDDDELLLQTFDTEEKLQNKGQIEPVCSEENIEEEEEYCFRSMKQEEDRVTFYRREIKHNGDEAQKDLFVWEKGKGLVKFETGYGPGPMEVTIDKIYEVTDEELVCGRSEAKPASGYRVPLEEIAERIEYEYIYENMIDHIADRDYKR